MVRMRSIDLQNIEELGKKLGEYFVFKAKRRGSRRKKWSAEPAAAERGQAGPR